MKKLIFILTVCIFIIIIHACKQDAGVETLNNDGVAPAPVTNGIVENLPGAATITYTLPNDLDLLYVKALYTTKQGVVRETKATYYNNSLTVVGFGDTEAYEVKLYAVDKGENVSTPLTVTVHPQKPTFLYVRDSIRVAPDFGGINVSFKNNGRNSIAIVVLSIDSLGNFVPFNTFYTDLQKGDFTTRGFNAVKGKFGIYVRDRWDNRSDTLIVEMTPFFETKLDRLKMKGLILPNDAPLGYGGNIAYLFDGFTSGGYYHTGDAARMPQWFTYDMGITAKLSRLSWWMREGSFYFSLHNPKVVEIWGSNNPSLDGSWTNWVLLATHEQIKPSGLPAGQLSQADVDAAVAGETVNFPLSAPAVRYIRFKTLKNWSSGSYVNFMEISMWGSPQ